MSNDDVVPPGEHPDDPYVKDIDAVAFALDRVQTYLIWIDEHRASFEAARDSDPETAESELSNLDHSTREARRHMTRLLELILAGYTINPSKRLPRGLQHWRNSPPPTPD
jgi:hypothetical protein